MMRHPLRTMAGLILLCLSIGVAIPAHGGIDYQPAPVVSGPAP